MTDKDKKSIEDKEERKDKKSKSVLSRYQSSKQDRYSIDFDDI